MLYDARTSRLSFIDFAEANYRFVYRDIFSPVSMELGVGRRIYDAYKEIHNDDLYDMPDANNPNIQKIMKFRMMTVLLRRFIKAADDLRVNPANAKSVENNAQKVDFMRDLMAKLKEIEAAVK